MTDTRACIRGCTIRSQHLTDCPGDDCTGCLPRPAQDGLLCWPCYANLERQLSNAPGLIRHIRANVMPGSGGPNESGVAAHDPYRIPFSARAVDDADALHALLSSWAQLHIEEHPGNLTGPSRIGSRTTEAGVIALKAGGDTQPTVEVVKWLLNLLPWACEQEWTGEYVGEVTRTCSVLMARWPEAERSRHIPSARCPECDRRTMVYYPPTFGGASIRVECGTESCSHRVPEDQWPWFARLLAEEQRLVAAEAARARRAEERAARKAAEKVPA